jgi:8-oxo-dGTP diphosphatase
MKQEEVQLDQLQDALGLRHSYFWYMGQYVGRNGWDSDRMPMDLKTEDQNSWIVGYREGLKQREDHNKGLRAKMKHEIGVAAVLFDDKGSVLLEHRGKHPGFGLYVLVGGMLDEPDPREGVAREVKEEVGLDIHPSRFTPVYSALHTHEDGHHSIMLYFACRIERGTERNMEPHKCQGLHWFKPYRLPTEEMWVNDRGAVSYADSIFDFKRMGIGK